MHSSTASKFQNYGQNINRYPTSLQQPQNLPDYYPHNQTPKKITQQRNPYRRSSVLYNSEILSEAAKNLLPNSIYDHPKNLQSVSSQQPVYHGNMLSNDLSSATCSLRQGQHAKNTNRNSSECFIPQYSAKPWPTSFNPAEFPSRHSITAATNSLINNSIIYKQSAQPIAQSSQQGFHQPHHTNGMYPRGNYPNYPASIQKPWDYIPKYNLQRVNQEPTLVPFEHHQNSQSQIRHSVSASSHYHPGENTSHDQHSKYQSHSSYHLHPQTTHSNTINSTYNKFTPNMNPNCTQTFTNNVSGAYHEMYNPDTKSFIGTQARTEESTKYSTMNDLIKITDQVLNNEIKFGNIGGERNKIQHQQNSHPPITTSDVTAMKCNQTNTKAKKAQQSIASGTLCYNCGAFVSSSTIADEVTTIAICHNCKEVLYFVTDENMSKDKRSYSVKHNHNSDQAKRKNDNTSNSTRFSSNGLDGWV